MIYTRSMCTSQQGPHGDGSMGTERSSWGLPMYKIHSPLDHLNPLMITQKSSPLKNECKVDPIVQSIWMGANKGANDYRGVYLDGPSSGAPL